MADQVLPPPMCAPPLVYNGAVCICPSGRQPAPSLDGPSCAPQFPVLVFPSQCALTVSYTIQAPDLPQIVTSGAPGCDVGIELALAATLAALLKPR